MVRLQIARVQQTITLHNPVVSRLQRIERYPGASDVLTIDELCGIIQTARVMEAYFSLAQLRVMHARGTALCVEQVRAIRAEWADLIPAMRVHWNRGTPSTHASVRQLARRWRELLHQFTEGDLDFVHRLGELAGHAPSDGMPEAGLMAYVGAALRDA